MVTRVEELRKKLKLKCTFTIQKKNERQGLWRRREGEVMSEDLVVVVVTRSNNEISREKRSVKREKRARTTAKGSDVQSIHQSIND